MFVNHFAYFVGQCCWFQASLHNTRFPDPRGCHFLRDHLLEYVCILVFQRGSMKHSCLDSNSITTNAIGKWWTYSANSWALHFFSITYLGTMSIVCKTVSFIVFWLSSVLGWNKKLCTAFYHGCWRPLLCPTPLPFPKGSDHQTSSLKPWICWYFIKNIGGCIAAV